MCTFIIVEKIYEFNNNDNRKLNYILYKSCTSKKPENYSIILKGSTKINRTMKNE